MKSSTGSRGIVRSGRATASFAFGARNATASLRSVGDQSALLVSSQDRSVNASHESLESTFAMALAKESETFDEYSIEKRGSCVRLEKQIGQFQCSFCSEETDFYDVRFEDTHWSVVPRQNMSPSGRRMTAEEVEEMERLQAAVTHLKVKFDLINKGQVSKAKSTRNASL